MYIIILGAPGAGKGTQAVFLTKEMNLAHVATGDLFRQALEKGTELGMKAKSYMEKGELVPDEITVQMVLERLSSPDCKRGAILDGFPRNLRQAEALDKALAKENKGIDKVLYIKVSEAELLGRLGGRWICRLCQAPCHVVSSPPKVEGKCDKCGGELYQRADDNGESIKKRLEVFFKDTAPMIDYYNRLSKLVEVDGEGDMEDVGERIVSALHSAG